MLHHRLPRLAIIAATSALIAGCAILTPRIGLSADEALAIARTDVDQPPLSPDLVVLPDDRPDADRRD